MNHVAEQWQPSAEQLSRLRRYEAWLMQLVEGVKTRDQLEKLASSAYRGDESFLQLIAEAPLADDFERCVADFYCFPAQVDRIGNRRYYLSHTDVRNRIWYAGEFTRHLLSHLAGDYARNLLLDRLRFMVWHPNSADDLREPACFVQYRELAAKQPEYERKYVLSSLDDALKLEQFPFLSPTPPELVVQCLELARSADEAEPVLALIEGREGPKLKLDLSFPTGVRAKVGQSMSSASFLLLGLEFGRILHQMGRLGVLEETRISNLLQHMHRDHPDLLYLLLSDELDQDLQPFRPIALNWLFDLANSQGRARLTAMARDSGSSAIVLSGSRFLLAAASLLQSKPLVMNKLDYGSAEWNSAQCIRLLANVRELDPGESHSELVQALRRFEPSVLRQLIGCTDSQFGPILAALSMAEACELWELIVAAEAQEAEVEFDAVRANQLLRDLGDKVDEVLALVAETQRFPITLKRIKAMRSGPDKKFDSMLKRLSQEHIRLYGLFPLKDDADLIQRYQYLRAAPKEASNKFGYERAGNVREAARVGLINLASTAGYADLAALEWAVEAKQADLRSELVTELAHEGYRLRMEIDQHKPKWVIEKNGALLKALPPALKKDPALEPILSTFGVLKDQAGRYRAALENLMVEGTQLDQGYLENLRRSPVALSMLLKLFLVDAAGRSGRLDAAEQGLLNCVGEPFKPTGPLRIAHVVDLLAEGSLADWQRWLVDQGWQQPFKQLFREAYVPTPVELEAMKESCRFAGRRVKSRVAAAILSARRWKMTCDPVTARKALGAGVTAHLELPEVNHFLAESETTVLDRIWFSRGREQQAVVLTELSPLAFSELMRDIDLIITAAAADSDLPSKETIDARCQLLQALLPTLRLPNVELKPPFALIRGKLANYRLHLGTAVIHLMPAGYLCVVPAPDSKRSRLQLPFVDDDARTQEVLSKLLLLAADHKIKDPSIVAQIVRGAAEESPEPAQ
ncbi:DUF4132 domain-containing protein [Pseudomarimonas arenosa]|uniref:DUF4132 domain-containing protein n=1 Tax=Pseudomarimonas arenosa TaxID=2774145 RepID=A0AAW3ZRK6_9GAMM|nr:DUF4132 domain-containing protein [Pseudomarimonas arenosa]MBD8527182.1 DUF4132 domain-containing protein [Pseudomarimonas arenosa]